MIPIMMPESKQSPPSLPPSHGSIQQAPESVPEPETKQSPPSPPPSHGSISSTTEAHGRRYHQPPGSQLVLPLSPSQAQPNEDHLRIRRSTSAGSPNSVSQANEDHVIDMPAQDEAGNANQLRPVNLGKAFVGLTYQSMVTFMVFHYSSSADIASLRHARIVSILLDLAVVAVVMGFTASLIGLLIREIYVEQARILETAGSASATLGFFLLVGMFMTKVSTVIGLLGGVGSFVAFVLVFLKMKKKGNHTRY